MEKWFQILREARQDKRPRPEPTPFKSKAQKQYKKQRRKNDIYSTTGGHKNPKSGAPYTNKTKRAGTDRLRFEDVEPETFEKQSSLNTKFWKEGDHLCRRASRRLTRIAQDFIDGLDMSIVIEDLRLTGSLANYNWSRYSDVDLHIVVDFSKLDENKELVKAFFDNARIKWNSNHDIKIHGYEVELYVEDVNEGHKSSGVYSIKNGEWIRQPDPDSVDIQFDLARKKSDDIATRINLIQHIMNKGRYRAAIKAIDVTKRKIRNMRKAGLHSRQQEFSAENIAFKILRREEMLQKLDDMKYDAYDKFMSMI